MFLKILISEHLSLLGCDAVRIGNFLPDVAGYLADSILRV